MHRGTWTALLSVALMASGGRSHAIDSQFQGDRHLRFEAADSSFAVEPASGRIAWPETFTLEAWVRLTTASPYAVIAGRTMADRGQDPYYHVALAFEGADGRTPALIASTGTPGTYRVANAGSAIALGRWVHVAGVRDISGTLRLYVDGVLSGTAQSAGPVAANPGIPFAIGAGARADGLEFACWWA